MKQEKALMCIAVAGLCLIAACVPVQPYNSEGMIKVSYINYSGNSNFEPINTPKPRFPMSLYGKEDEGDCKMRFDVTPMGKPVNIKAVNCSHVGFKMASILSIKELRYPLPHQQGDPVFVEGVEYNIKFLVQQ